MKRPSKAAIWFLLGVLVFLGLAVYSARMGWKEVFTGTGAPIGLCLAGAIIFWNGDKS